MTQSGSGRAVGRFIVVAIAVPILAAQAIAQESKAVPDLSGIWWHPSLPGIEPLASGPTSLTNRTRRKEDGASDYNQLVGDYTNPILQPWAADIVKKHGDLSIAGVVYPNPANQCWPEPGPFIYKNFALQILQQPHQVTLLYEQDHEVRRVRMNQQHPVRVTPSWYGDSIGYYEGDTLVIDTVGIRADRPYAMVDLYGTPYTGSLHMVERYRLVDYENAKEGLDRDAQENFRPPGASLDIDRNYRGKHLQVHFTVDDPGAFTTPWSATVTYRPGSNEWPEIACAENPQIPYDKDADVPTALKADF
jgi:hypothetical protein